MNKTDFWHTHVVWETKNRENLR